MDSDDGPIDTRAFCRGGLFRDAPVCEEQQGEQQAAGKSEVSTEGHSSPLQTS
jgi:hypothetical protein